MGWIHSWVRRHTKPIPRVKARLWHTRLSVAYYMFAWTAVGIVVYDIATGQQALPDHLNVHVDSDANGTASHKYIKMYDTNEAVIYKIRGFKVNDVVEYKKEGQLRGDQEKKEVEDFFGNGELLKE